VTLPHICEGQAASPYTQLSCHYRRPSSATSFPYESRPSYQLPKPLCGSSGSSRSYANGPNSVDSYNTQTNGLYMNASDAQLPEGPQHEKQTQNSHRTWGLGCSDKDSTKQYGACSTNRALQRAFPVPPKRKRLFSNRTKTGCMTCRKRKKKCDEGHPYCKYLRVTV
jgi:hypothetical protein